MSDYRDYLEESTNVVKSKTRLSKTVLISAYLVIWAVAILVFWVFISGSDALGYSLMFLWGILPITTFVIALLIGKNGYLGKYKWFSSIVFGLMYMLSEYFTFSMANNVSAEKVNAPRLSLLAVGILISLAGLGISCLVNKKKD